MRAAERRIFVTLNVLLLVISVALLAYVVYALLRPEKF
jgi:K+-transporting ATPase KdpF subunit